MNVNSSSIEGTSSRRATISGRARPDEATGSEPAWSQMRVDIGAIVAGPMGTAQSRRPTTFQAVTGWLMPFSDRPSMRSASTPASNGGTALGQQDLARGGFRGGARRCSRVPMAA